MHVWVTFSVTAVTMLSSILPLIFFLSSEHVRLFYVSQLLRKFAIHQFLFFLFFLSFENCRLCASRNTAADRYNQYSCASAGFTNIGGVHKMTFDIASAWCTWYWLIDIRNSGKVQSCIMHLTFGHLKLCVKKCFYFYKELFLCNYFFPL